MYVDDSKFIQWMRNILVPFLSYKENQDYSYVTPVYILNSNQDETLLQRPIDHNKWSTSKQMKGVNIHCLVKPVCKYVTSKTVHQKENVPNANHFNNIQPLNNEKDWLG